MKRDFLEGLLGENPEAVEAILQQHQKELDEVVFSGMLSGAIRDAGARSEKAVAALLDVDGIRASDDPAKAAKAALQQLKKEQDYLFASPVPRYAPGTGTGSFEKPEPQGLAAALKARFGK